MKLPSLEDVKAWTGLAAAMAGAGLQHQLVSDSLHFDCRYGHNDLPVGVAALALIAVGALVSWSALRSSDSRSGATRRFVARMSLMAAMLFALMVLWGLMAGAILPACP
jgi:hypothetical protein